MSLDQIDLKIDNALAEWRAIPVKTRRALIQELGGMAIESAEEDRAFSAACNCAANLLHSLCAESSVSPPREKSS